jgi:hypothetical protein
MEKYNLKRKKELKKLNVWLTPTKFSIVEKDKSFVLKKEGSVDHIIKKAPTVTKVHITEMLIEYTK